MNCAFSVINGLNKDLVCFLATAKGVAIHDPATSFATKTAASSLEGWRVLQEETLKLYVLKALSGTEVTAIEGVEETDGFGNKHVGAFNPPSMIMNLNTNPADFAELVKKGSQTVRGIIFNEDGKKMATQGANGIIRGYEAQMVAIPLAPQGSNERGAKKAMYKVHLNFQEVDEFNNTVVWDDGNKLSDYLENMPIGYDQEITSPLSTDSMSVKITKRGDITVLGTDTFTAEIISSNNCAAPSVTVGAITAGVSVLTIYSTGTTPLVAGQSITYRLVKKTSSIYDIITNELTAKL